MEAFLRDLLDGGSPDGVVDLCLDHSLTASSLEGKFTAIGGLDPFVDLEVLSICGHSLGSTTGMPALPRLHTLLLAQNELELLPGLEGLTGLRTLDLSHNLLISAVIPPFERLETLDLGHNHLRSLDGLPSLPMLQQLQLSGNRGLQSLDALALAPRLKTLGLRQCHVSSWEGLSALQGLEVLSISPGAMDGLVVLASLPRLRTLHISAQRLSGRVQLPKMPGLEELSLSGGVAVTEVDGLEALQGLRRLSLKGNGLRRVPDVGCLPALARLDLSDNPLQSREGIPAAGSGIEVVLRNTGLA